MENTNEKAHSLREEFKNATGIAPVFANRLPYINYIVWLESELAKSQEKCKAYEGALGLSQAWPITDVMQKLVESTEYLLDVKNYDLTGWEEVSHCTKLGRGYVSKINAVLAEQALKTKY